MSQENEPLVSRRKSQLVEWENDGEDLVSKVKSRIGLICAVGITTLVIIGVIISVAIGWVIKPKPDPKYLLADEVIANECENILNHIYALEEIALNYSSRAVMTGYNDSADYIMSTLRGRANCEIKTEKFKTAIFTELSSPTLTMISPSYIEFQEGVDFAGLRYGGNGAFNVTNVTCFVPNEGCSPSDFDSITPGCIALIQVKPSGDCSLIDKAMPAQEKGAGAIILYNTVDGSSLATGRVRAAGWFPGNDAKTLMEKPVLAGSYSLGSLFKESPNAIINLQTNTVIEIVDSFNVFCVTKEGSPNDIIVVGAHLDSVPEGPGMNDNGSGSTTLLEIVLKWYEWNFRTNYQIWFSWWGSEETGLIGSRNFVRDRNNTNTLNQIIMNLNFDMLASPNYYLGIHDGSTTLNENSKNGSIVITRMFEEYFNEYLELPYNLIALRSGSDFVPFVEAGIPAGGLAAGAGGIKGEEDRETFGGLANAAYDPCYHQSCDTSLNINTEVLSYLAGAASYVVQKIGTMDNLREHLNTPPEDFLNTRQQGVTRVSEED